MKQINVALAALMAAPWMMGARPPEAKVSAYRHVRKILRAPKVKPALRSARPPACEGLWDLPRGQGLPFEIGEELAYELSVAGAAIGKFETKVGKPRTVSGRRVLPLFGRARTTGFAASFEPFWGRWMSMAEPGRLLPLGLRVESNYGGDDRWEKVMFRDARKRVRADFTLKGRQLQRNYTSGHAMTDLLSMLYFARQVQLNEGLKACQHVFGARRLWRMDAHVVGSDRVLTPAGRLDAWKLKISFDRMPTRGLNNRVRPHYDMDVYLAKDRTRTPLAFVVRYKGVTARGDLSRWSLTGKSDDGAWAF